MRGVRAPACFFMCGAARLGHLAKMNALIDIARSRTAMSR
jgi:hypothetical protein